MHSIQVTEPVFANIGALLECPTFDKRNGILYYIDITNCKVMAYKIPQLECDSQSASTILNLSAGDVKIIDTPSVVGHLSLTSDEKILLLGLKNGIYLLNVETEKFEILADYSHGSNLQSNDGAVAPDGKFWIGTMSEDEKRGSGSLYYFENNKLVKFQENVSVPNGTQWIKTGEDSYDMIWADSGDGAVYKIPYQFGQIPKFNERKVLFSTPKAATFGLEVTSQFPGEPDGSCLDENDNLYICLWEGNRVVRISKDGSCDLEIVFPVSNVTCCCFINGDLWVTTAESSEGQNNGGLWKVEDLKKFGKSKGQWSI
ncbi:hypothetical protein DAMA08_053270 [Martiniozyma asiatica (nom. inval.)]|nr:hypothetical protein DAMA08_053270 [Martiniozyma asiatica]